MEFIVRPNDFKASYVEFDVSCLPPPLLASSFTRLWFLSYAPIQHIRVYMSHLTFLTESSNNQPYNREHIIVIYHKPLSIQ